MLKFKFTHGETEDHKVWISFFPKRNKGTGFSFTFENNGYFDPRPQINTNITSLLAIILPFISLWLLPITLVFCFYSWGSLYIRLPFDTGRGDTSESNVYGLTFYHVDCGFPTMFWIRGWKSFDFPWAYKYWRKEILLKTGWKKEEKGDDFWDTQKWKDKILFENHQYTYNLKSGDTQTVMATISEEKMYFRRWFKLFTKCIHSIEIEFSSDIGERRGSWKGGCIGCSYRMLPGETPYECLMRMQKERKF